jgi:hypothetical protein
VVLRILLVRAGGGVAAHLEQPVEAAINLPANNRSRKKNAGRQALQVVVSIPNVRAIRGAAGHLEQPDEAAICLPGRQTKGQRTMISSLHARDVVAARIEQPVQAAVGLPVNI